MFPEACSPDWPPKPAPVPLLDLPPSLAWLLLTPFLGPRRGGTAPSPTLACLQGQATGVPAPGPALQFSRKSAAAGGSPQGGPDSPRLLDVARSLDAGASEFAKYPSPWGFLYGLNCTEQPCARSPSQGCSQSPDWRGGVKLSRLFPAPLPAPRPALLSVCPSASPTPMLITCSFCPHAASIVRN